MVFAVRGTGAGARNAVSGWVGLGWVGVGEGSPRRRFLDDRLRAGSATGGREGLEGIGEGFDGSVSAPWEPPCPVIGDSPGHVVRERAQGDPEDGSVCMLDECVGCVFLIDVSPGL